MAAYLTAALNENDPELVLAALNDVAHAKGIANLAEATGLNREIMCEALMLGAKPRFDTIFRIIQGLNLKLEAIVIPESA